MWDFYNETDPGDITKIARTQTDTFHMNVLLFNTGSLNCGKISHCPATTSATQI